MKKARSKKNHNKANKAKFALKKKSRSGSKSFKKRGNFAKNFDVTSKKVSARRNKKEEKASDRPNYKTPEELIAEREVFPDSVKKEVSHVRNSLSATTIAKELNAGRRDLRNLTLVTIDSEETKDVDDAVSISRTKEGKYVLGVHIADVAHYVKEGTELDLEAYKRGTSVYLVDKVLPMLPKKLSNGICSLNVGEDRLALSVEMVINQKGQVEKYDIFESLICVEYKITYKQITALFEGDSDLYRQKDLEEEFKEYIADIKLMKELAEIRHRMRYQRGAVDFEFPETYVATDENGKPIKVEESSVNFANNIIEEFMLAANETIAEHFAKLKVPFMFRVHADPDPEKLENLGTSVRSMGYTLKGDGDDPAFAIQRLLEKAKGKAAEPIISMLALRSMQKAEYSPANEGHFGLAAEYYTHFTSPIRRYPDLFIHRIIKAVLRGKLNTKQEAFWRSVSGDAVKHCSFTEREAENAERMYTERLVAEYMNGFLGDAFSGTICNITGFGIFVKLDNSAEGLVFYNSMPDYMIFDERKMIAIGETNRRKYAIGDKVRVKVVNCNVKMGQIEFHFIK
ncbi:MAG: VacB/RNase II family 3'-5' exoribonuclease [Ruminococcaceae bacterium]|nr:VacB/RNase II family 3'-5' exoribonuclease [Oscillospiraceae bacterium]